MITVEYIVSILFSSLFVCGFAQYYGYSPYPYNYGYNNYGSVRPYPVSTQNYIYRPSPCRSSCNSCQYLPCYNNYVQQQPYYQPYAYYTSRQYGNPYVNYFRSNKKSPDIYANVPVEIIDDDTVLPYNINRKQQDEYANVPVEIIDDDGSTDFWKKIPFLPKTKTSSYSNYTVNQGRVVNNSHTESKPIRATIVRQFQPQHREFKIDFLNGAPLNNSTTEGKGQSVENTTTRSEEETTVVTDTNEVTGKEDSEDVSPVRNWLFN